MSQMRKYPNTNDAHTRTSSLTVAGPACPGPFPLSYGGPDKPVQQRRRKWFRIEILVQDRAPKLTVGWFSLIRSLS